MNESPKPKWTGQRYEYRFYVVPSAGWHHDHYNHSTEPIEAELNKMGQEGWEILGTEKVDGGYLVTAKRTLESKDQKPK